MRSLKFHWPSFAFQALSGDNVKQAIKTGLAGAIAMFLAERFKLPQGYWAAVSAVIVMQSEFRATLKIGLERIAGTAIGALVVLPFAELAHGNLIAFATAVVMTVLACNFLNLGGSQRLGASTVALIMLIDRPEAPWVSAIFRFLEVSFGIGVALLVTRFVWPAHSQKMAAQHPVAEVDKGGKPKGRTGKEKS